MKDKSNEYKELLKLAESMSEANKDFMVEQCKKRYENYGANLGEESLNKKIEEIKNGPIYGADDTFKRLIIIYKKQGLYENALEICDKAIEFGENNLYYNKKRESY